jgi:hypothetical protein
MSHVVTLRIPDKEAWERAKQYARKQGGNDREDGC